MYASELCANPKFSQNMICNFTVWYVIMGKLVHFCTQNVLKFGNLNLRKSFHIMFAEKQYLYYDVCNRLYSFICTSNALGITKVSINSQFHHDPKLKKIWIILTQEKALPGVSTFINGYTEWTKWINHSMPHSKSDIKWHAETIICWINDNKISSFPFPI